MQITFDNLDELKGFLKLIAEHQAPITLSADLDDKPIVAEVSIVAGAPPVMVPPASAPEAQQKRTRRTKAEMAAAANIAQRPEAPAEPVVVKEADPEPERVIEYAMPTDANEFIAAQMAERPELSQLEHLNIARSFISAKGMEKYNQTFALAGLPANVMGYSPADCARHAAAMSFLEFAPS